MFKIRALMNVVFKLETQIQEIKLFAIEILGENSQKTYLNSSQNWFTKKSSKGLKWKKKPKNTKLP